jgi:hypothetical protein
MPLDGAIAIDLLDDKARRYRYTENKRESARKAMYRKIAEAEEGHHFTQQRDPFFPWGDRGYGYGSFQDKPEVQLVRQGKARILDHGLRLGKSKAHGRLQRKSGLESKALARTAPEDTLTGHSGWRAKGRAKLHLAAFEDPLFAQMKNTAMLLEVLVGKSTDREQNRDRHCDVERNRVRTHLHAAAIDHTRGLHTAFLLAHKVDDLDGSRHSLGSIGCSCHSGAHSRCTCTFRPPRAQRTKRYGEDLKHQTRWLPRNLRSSVDPASWISRSLVWGVMWSGSSPQPTFSFFCCCPSFGSFGKE